MIHLMKLELKKYRMNKYILISISLIIFSIIFITISLIDSATDPTQGKDSFEAIFEMIGVLLSFIFVVFYGVLVSSLIVKEYNTKTILIMFSYPVDKKKLVLSKLLVINIFICISLLIGYICCCSYIITIDFFFNLLSGNFIYSFLGKWLWNALLTTIICICLGTWTFNIGMFKKSVPITIVSSIIVIFIRQTALSSLYGYTENLVQTFIIVIVTIPALQYILKNKVNKIE